MNYYYSQNEALVVSFILCVLSSFAAYSAVKRKNRNSIWVLLTFLFPPFFFVVECLSNKSIQTIQMIDCEACHKEISSASKICPHCGHPNHLYKKNKIPFYEWIAGGLITIIMIFIIIIPPTSTTDGIPNCDTPFTQELALHTFKQIPRMHKLGFSAVDLKNIQEVSSSSTEKRCKATAMLTNDIELSILYQLTKQNNGAVYLKIQLGDE